MPVFAEAGGLQSYYFDSVIPKSIITIHRLWSFFLMPKVPLPQIAFKFDHHSLRWKALKPSTSRKQTQISYLDLFNGRGSIPKSFYFLSSRYIPCHSFALLNVEEVKMNILSVLYFHNKRNEITFLWYMVLCPWMQCSCLACKLFFFFLFAITVFFFCSFLGRNMLFWLFVNVLDTSNMSLLIKELANQSINRAS